MAKYGFTLLLGSLRPMAWAGVPMLALLLASWGCTPIQVWMGSRVRLEKTPIGSVEASLPLGPAMAPGDKSPLMVTVIQPDGTALWTEGSAKGKVLWEDVHVTAMVAVVNAKGIVSLPMDPRLSDGKLPHLSISIPSHPELHVELDIPLRYDRSYSVDFSGRSGLSGMDGSNGMDGLSGSSGSMDPNNPSPGGSGSSGSNGSDGQSGWPGEDALPVYVQVAFRPGPRPLLQVSMSSAGRIERFLIDPQGGSLTVKAEGGAGGSGGRGGRGGRGGSGGMGSPDGSSGSDGLSGQDGMAGSAGKPGSITVTYDPQAKPYIGALVFPHRDGRFRSGPLPVFREEEVPPLW
jgi:hypothetical protein